MARSATVGSIMLNHLHWKDDHMSVHIPKTKSDQTGELTFPKSLFANPCNPAICPVLALAVVVFCRPYRDSRTHPLLFDGPDQEDRYCKILSRVLRDLPEGAAATLGANKEDIGSHSARKGAPSHILAMPGGPSAVATFLRAGWSLGSVKDRYIFEGDGGDAFCGRAV